MPGLGHNGYLAIVKEVTWGTDPLTTYTAQQVLSESLTAKPSNMFIEEVRGSREGAGRAVAMGIVSGGAFNFDCDVEGAIGLLLKSLLSTEVFIDQGVGNGGLHTFTPGATVPSFSCLINRDTLADATNIWDYVGCTCDKLDLSAAEGQLLKAAVTVSAKNGVNGATGITPSYSTQNPLVYHQATVTSGGVSVNAKSFKLSIASGNYSKRGALGTRFVQQQQPGVMKVTGELDLYFDRMTDVNAFIASTDLAIVITLNGATLGTSTRNITITIPVARYTGTPPVIASPSQEIMLKLPFTAWQSGSGSPNHIVQVSVLNSLRSAY